MIEKYVEEVMYNDHFIITIYAYLFDIFFPFLNVSRYIDEEDLLSFLKTVEIHTIFPLFEGAVETGKITKSSFRNWVVKNPKPICFIFGFKGSPYFVYIQ